MDGEDRFGKTTPICLLSAGRSGPAGLCRLTVQLISKDVLYAALHEKVLSKETDTDINKSVKRITIETTDKWRGGGDTAFCQSLRYHDIPWQGKEFRIGALLQRHTSYTHLEVYEAAAPALWC